MIHPGDVGTAKRNRRARLLARATAMVEALEVRRLFAFPSLGLLSTADLPAVTRLPLSGAASFAPVESSFTQTGGLAGRIVITSGGHGYAWGGSSWSTGRGLTNGIVEDLGNQDQMSFYADLILQAGATVIAMRPVGHQLNEVIVDNSDAGFTTPSGTWSSSVNTPYFSTHNGDDAAHYRFIATSTTETAVARFTPTISTAGFYPVYTWAKRDTDRPPDQLYRVNYTGGSIEIKINHQQVGHGWVYLGTYYFASGTAGNVEISNKSSVTGKFAIADAIRFGNGMGDVDRGGGVSGKPREDEASYYWISAQRGWNGVNNREPLSLFDGGNSLDDDANVGAPAKWGKYMVSAPFGQSIYLGFHTNAAGGRGVVGLWNDENLFPGTATPNQFDWAKLIGDEINDDMVGIGSPPLEVSWFERGSNTTFARSDFAFGEIRTSATGDEFDATIAEVAFHDNASDAQLLRDPKVRKAVARASYHATVNYFNQFGGGSIALMPDVPTNVRAITNNSGGVVLTWTAPATNASTGNAGAATGYKIYTSSNGLGFDNPITVGNVTTTTINGLSTVAPTYFKIVATNAGGESLGSSVVVAKPQTGATAPILIVNGYDRYERTLDEKQAYGASTTDRVRLRYQNTFDYVAQFGDAIKNFNPALGIDTAQNDDIISGAINLASYNTVLWISGAESVADETFNSTEQTKITTYINAGGKVFVSGSELGFDLFSSGTAADKTFFNSTLHAGYVSDDAGTYNTTGVAGSIFASVGTVSFDNGTFGTYDVATPDVLSTNAGSTAALNYSGGSGGIAALQWTSGNSRVVIMGFPFETIRTSAQRNSIMSGVLTYFGTSAAILSSTPGTPDLVAATDSGSSNSDNRTNFNNSSGKALQFTVGSTIAGATVTIYADNVAIGSALASGTTTTVTTNASNTLLDGGRSITARQTEPTKAESNNSVALTVTVDTTAPSPPGTPVVNSSTNSISLDWPNNGEGDLLGYDVYRATVSGGPYTKINASVVGVSAYTDSTVTMGITYYYVVKALDTAGNTSGNSTQVSGVTNSGVSATPDTPNMLSTTDSGVSGNDDITNYDNSTSPKAPRFFIGGTVAGATVTLYSDGNPIGSASATGATLIMFANGVTDLADGVHAITARQTQSGLFQSPASAPMNLTIDTAGPTGAIPPVSPEPHNGAIAEMTVDFGEAVVNFDLADLALKRDGGANLLGGTQTPTGGTNGVYTVPNLAGLTDVSGNYVLSVISGGSGITDLAGNAIVAGGSDSFNMNVINGDAIANANDTFRITPVDTDPNGVNIFVNNNSATPDYVWTFTAGQQLIINGLGGNDLMDVTGPIGVDIVFNGGTQSSADSLSYTGDGVEAATYAPSGVTPGSGTISLDNGHSLYFAGLEPVTMSELGTVTFVTPNSVDVLSIDSPVGGRNRISGTSGGVAFESLTFFNVDSMIVQGDTYDGGGSGNDSLTINSSGLVASGLANFRFVGGAGSDTLNVNGGSYTFNSDASSDSDNLTINVNPDNTGTATVLFNSSEHVMALNIGNGGQASLAVSSGQITVITRALSIAAQGKLDLSDGALVLDYAATDASPLATVRGMILAGRGGTDFAGGNWNGMGGIASSAAAAQDLISFAIGYTDNSFLPQVGLPSYSEFRGQAVDSSAILVRYTLGADANLDGKVNSDDVTIVSALYNNPATGDWVLGDFDYDGMCETDDVTVISAMYDPTAPPLFSE